MLNRKLKPERADNKRLPRADSRIVALIANVTAVKPNVDTIELYFPGPLASLKGLRLAQWGQWLEYKPCEDQEGNVWGHRLKLNVVARDAFPILDDMVRTCGATVRRFDIAYDFFGPDPEELKQLEAFLLRHGILLWNRATEMHDEDHGSYFGSLKGRKGKQTPRGLLLYGDNPAKGCHLELRIFGTASVRRQGVTLPSDILALDPAALLRRNFRLIADVDADRKAFVQKLQRRAVEDDRRSAVKAKGRSALVDRYRALIPHRIDSLVRHLCAKGRAQELHMAFKMPMKVVDLNVLQIPNKLILD